jgi:error-prone DNA polymerase
MAISASLIVFAELVCQSHYTFLTGASSPEELVERAHDEGYSALALTDECSFAGVVKAHMAAKRLGLKLIVGSRFTCDDGLQFALLAKNREGYAAISALITLARMRSQKGAYLLKRNDIADGIADCLCIWLPHGSCNPNDLEWLNARFAGEIAIAVTNALMIAKDDETLALAGLSKDSGIPCIATNDALMHCRQRKTLADTVTAIRLGKTISECGQALAPNGERHLRPIRTLRKLFPAEWLANTVAIAARSSFSLDSLRYEYPEEIVPLGETATTHLRKLTLAGMTTRYPMHDVEEIAAREKCTALIERELKLIAELRYEAFFLTVHDIVVFARSRNILCQGRGSAANSAVCYCLGITAVDPGRSEVLFERFISKERNEAPDIDVDFEHHRREEVIQYIYQKYGRHRAALAATVICYRRRSAIRDVGKALGFELTQLEALSQTIAWWDKPTDLPDRLREAGFDSESPITQQFLNLIRELNGVPRHLSQHVGGFVIARDAVSRMVPVENAAMPDRSIIQWDKDDLESLGLLKVDVLALGMLTAIRLTLDLINQYYGTRLQMHEIPDHDKATFDMMCRADTVGVFQIESRAQMSMLPRLKPRQFYDLVIEVAIVRPGPIQGGMVHPYLRRRDGREAVTYPSQDVERVLERTLGVSIFQEQVMKLAEVAAGFTPGEADLLRRAMAAWKRKGGLEPFRDKLINGMRDRGYEAEYAERIYKQIQGFGEYGFPESHAASFAHLAYVSAWLKCHHPAAFACALLNAMPMGFYSASQIIQDVRRHDVEVRAVDVTASAYLSTLEVSANRRPAIRLGLHQIKCLSKNDADRVCRARAISPFLSLQDFSARCDIDKKALAALAAADAFSSLPVTRRTALWNTMGMLMPTEITPQFEQDLCLAMLSTASEHQEVMQDYINLGFSLRKHPLALLRPLIPRHVTAMQLEKLPSGRRVRATGLVTCRQRPGTASGVLFITLEDETGNINVVVWGSLADMHRQTLLATRLLTVFGRLEKTSGVTHLIAEDFDNASALVGQLPVVARNFQ